MKSHTTLQPLEGNSIALTIGTFDGIHRGHLALFERLHQLGTTTVCITFSNHPSTVLHPNTPTPLLCTRHHQERLIAAADLDHLFILPFTPHFAAQSAETFLTTVHNTIPFSYLVLGHDARLGRQREGSPERIQRLGAALGFAVKYLPPLNSHGAPISSSRIRRAVQAGDLLMAADLLGRKVSFYSVVHKGAGHGRRIGAPTANLDIAGICVPPFGVYAITLVHGHHAYPGVANLGVAPTLQKNRVPMLEAHVFDISPDLYEHEVEVVLHAFLRPEQHFDSAELLRAQIQHDIAQARAILSSPDATAR